MPKREQRLFREGAGRAEERVARHVSLRRSSRARGDAQRCAHSVPAAVLRLVQRVVGLAEQRLLVVRVRGVRRDPDAHGQRTAPCAVRVREPVRRDRLADLLGDDEGAGGVGLGQHDRELLAAVAGDDVDLAHDRRQHPAELGERRVAGDVTVRVVEALEVVGVDHEQRQVLAVALRARDLVVEPLLQVAVVAQAGELVGDREALGELVEPRVLDRDDELARHRVEDEPVLVGEPLHVLGGRAEEHHRRPVVEHAQARQMRLDLPEAERASRAHALVMRHPDARREERLGLLLVEHEQASAGKSMTFEMISSTSGPTSSKSSDEWMTSVISETACSSLDATRELLVDLLAILDRELDLALSLSLRADRVGDDDAQKRERERPRPDEPKPGERTGRRERVPDRVGGRDRDRGQNRRTVARRSRRTGR